MHGMKQKFIHWIAQEHCSESKPPCQQPGMCEGCASIVGAGVLCVCKSAFVYYPRQHCHWTCCLWLQLPRVQVKAAQLHKDEEPVWRVGTAGRDEARVFLQRWAWQTGGQHGWCCEAASPTGAQTQNGEGPHTACLTPCQQLRFADGLPVWSLSTLMMISLVGVVSNRCLPWTSLQRWTHWCLLSSHTQVVQLSMKASAAVDWTAGQEDRWCCALHCFLYSAYIVWSLVLHLHFVSCSCAWAAWCWCWPLPLPSWLWLPWPFPLPSLPATCSVVILFMLPATCNDHVDVAIHELTNVLAGCCCKCERSPERSKEHLASICSCCWGRC